MLATSRLAWCRLACLLPVLPITARLTSLQIIDRQALASKAHAETQRISLEIAPRGRILDRSGNVLAESLPSRSSFLDPQSVRRPEQLVAALSRTLKIAASEIRRKLKSRSRFLWLKRHMELAEVEALERLRLQGVGMVADQERCYPNGDMAQNLLGGVGRDGRGLSGLELQFDPLLAGKPVRLRWMRDGSGNAVTFQPERTVQAPPDLRLTLDQDFQHYAQAALEDGVSKYHPQKALVMIQDPRTGEILAVASYPHDPMKVYSIQDAYEPGSTYKLVTMAGILEEKMSATGEQIDGEGGRWSVVPSVSIKDHEPSGAMTLDEVLEKSSNIGAAKLALRLGPGKFYDYSRAFGFGSRTSLAYPGESPGLLKPPAEMTRVTLANNGFGQGLAVTPLQLLDAYSGIANGGALMEPRLLLAAGGQSDFAPLKVRQAVSPETARRLTQMLEGVVERGTGMTAQVPGYFVAGKTGTAQKVDPETGRYSPTQYVASFIGFAPSRDPKLTVLVMMDSPKNQYYGADVAAPIFAKLMRELLALKGIPPDRPIQPASHASLSRTGEGGAR